jgi:hypothetical protein
MDREQNDFKGQLKYEHFQFFFRKHWIRFIQPILFTIPVGLLILVILMAVGQVTLLVDYTFVRALYTHFTLIVAVIYLMLASMQMINFYFDMCIVTDTRILIIKKTIFLRNNSDAIDLTKIQDIAVESHGVLSNYLQYGKLIITLSTSAPPIVIHYVPDPHFYLEWINRVKREHILKRRTDRIQPREQQSGKSDYLQEIRNLNL